MKKKALLLLNMGGPSNEAEIKLFLINMFNDPHILTVPTPIRKLLAFLITQGRLKAATANYARIGGASPIVGHTKRLVEKLRSELPEIAVDFVMRYTPPRASTVLAGLKEKGVEELFLIPLYPQYSTTTTLSSLEEIETLLKKLDFSPTVHRIERFYERPDYNAILVAEVKRQLTGENPGDFDLVFSAHSLPQKIVDRGDPYENEINDHAALLMEALEADGLYFKNLHIAYQSKLGPVKWLEPSLKSVLEGVENTRVIILPLSFTIDNSETDFELSIEFRELWEAKGSGTYRVCRCPNDNDGFVQTLAAIYRELRA
jgi:ferrochelatase